ncbi:hypothetical protein EVJ58_g2775 [Rhodofomes roseus]|uniref:Uncharacterized protein n=1 Tax=Rhodofomes roseus TaxID=34475 RepID=A0A4Y9YQX8_9APHY|nr:hypothetical protein EVJ58_g2775 [Rhodofomes roseus]
MADADLYNLEFLSLVLKITQEIDNHSGINDKTLAEFVIDLHEQSKTLSVFKQKLKDAGANFPDSFVENVDRLILRLHPKLEKPLAGDKENVAADAGVLDKGNKEETHVSWSRSEGSGVGAWHGEGHCHEGGRRPHVPVQFEGAAKRARGRPAEGERSPKR